MSSVWTKLFKGDTYCAEGEGVDSRAFGCVETFGDKEGEVVPGGGGFVGGCD